MFERLRSIPFWGSAAGLVAGVLAWLVGADTVAAAAWIVATVIALVPATVESVRDLLRRHAGVDIVALIAMAGALALQEWFAGAVIAVMLTGGEALERRASARAYRDLAALLEKRPAFAHRVAPSGEIEEVAVEEIVVGDTILVRLGEVVPVDGVLLEGRAVLDESTLTGETRPIEITGGNLLRSGAVNVGGPIRLRASATAEHSTYENIIKLVRSAEEAKPRFVRLADRYAGVFAPFALLVAGLAWALTGDPVRALAVVVVATPCPLILAAPAAIVSGVSRAAREGLVIKGGAGLEALANARIALLDKTGTITQGKPEVTRIESMGARPAEEVLRLAAALDQVSLHPFAPAIVRAARARGLDLAFPDEVEEQLGAGISGRVDGETVRVGQLAWVAGSDPVPRAAEALAEEVARTGASAVFVACEGEICGALVLEDAIDPHSAEAIEGLRRAGFAQVLMVTGDRRRIAEHVGAIVGVDRVLAERSPEGKVLAVREARLHGPTMMAGDGVNDAPALALADVGVAMGARGATAAADAADVVVTAHGLDGVVRAVEIAQRSRRIARQSAVGGMSLAGVAMVVAAFGYLPPAVGAVVQEVIDLAVILNALRALRDRRANDRPLRRPDRARDHEVVGRG